MNPPRCSPLEKAMRLLSVSARSEKELKEKLLKSGYGPTEAEAAVAECVRRGYVNDALLAQDFTACSIGRGSGPRRVRQKLLRRGVAKEFVQQALEENAELEPESARSVLAVKWRSLARETDPYKKKAKAFRFLVGRGFAPGLVAELIDEIMSSAETETEN